jgi:hypothetical protein
MDGNNHDNSKEPQSPWQFKPGETVKPGESVSNEKDDHQVVPQQVNYDIPKIQPRMQSNDNSISWTASEFIHHHKSVSWYLISLVSGFALAAVVFLLSKDKISTSATVVVTIIFTWYATHQPKQVSYRLGENIISIGSKPYSLNAFRSFFITSEGAFSSVTLLPLKRFGLPLTIYYDPVDEAKIMELLNNYLPMDQQTPDAIDNFMRKIRF